MEVYSLIKSYCRGRRGPIGDGEVTIRDDNGTEHVFYLETFFNGHEALTIGQHRYARVTSSAV
jgi:hypothetical protein